jgi:hypothetical protein
MKILISFIMVILRIFILVYMVYLLYMTKKHPSEYPVENLIWWICFLCFDIWLQFMMPNDEKKED